MLKRQFIHMVGLFMEVSDQIQHVTPNQFEQMIKDPDHPLIKQLFTLEQEIRNVREHIIEPGKVIVIEEKIESKDSTKLEVKDTVKKQDKKKDGKQDKKKDGKQEVEKIDDSIVVKDSSVKKELSIKKEEKKEDKSEKKEEIDKKDKSKIVLDDYKMVTSDQLELLTVDDLRDICTEKRIKRGGIKAEVKERLNELNLRMNDLSEAILEKIRSTETTRKDKEKDKEKEKEKDPEVKSNQVKEEDNQQKPLYMRKQNIPRHIKTLVWNKYCGIESVTSKCVSCRSETIDCRSFHCGHVLSEAKGGDMTISNLRPICPQCNLSMGTQSMEEFTLKFFGWDIPK